jgi:hypothetical protein
MAMTVAFALSARFPEHGEPDDKNTDKKTNQYQYRNEHQPIKGGAGIG